MKSTFIKFYILLSIILVLTGCSFFSSPTIPEVKITSIKLALTSASVKVGGLEYIGVTVLPVEEQNNIKMHWEYNKEIIDCSVDNFGVVISGKKEGETILRVTASGISASCKITVSGTSSFYEQEPYIYSNYSIVELKPNVTQRINVSLYGGLATDAGGFQWTIDKPSVATLESNGQYCNINTHTEGSALITVTHSKSTYAYNILVYVYSDILNSTYITTTNNIVSLYRSDGEKNIAVDLKNPQGTNYSSDFVWRLVDNNGNPIQEAPVQLSANAQNAVITPKTNGQCVLRITHPQAAYSVDILIRVITIVQNVYIEPSTTIVYLSADKPQTVTAALAGTKDTYSPDEFEWVVENEALVSSVSFGNQIMLTGTANGATKVIVSHVLAQYPREIMVVVRDQSFVDASMYITTSQNYIRTKIGAQQTDLNIMLYGGIPGDERNFVWNVVHTPDTGGGNVINTTTTNGTVTSRAAATYAFGTLHIEPITEGTAVITVTHPKVLYPTEILIKVLSANALLEQPMYVNVQSLLMLLNGNSATVMASLSGNVNPSDETLLTWTSEDTAAVSVAANGLDAQFTANGTAQNQTYVTVAHPKAEAAKKVLVLSANTQEELNAMKTLYANKTNYSACVEDIVQVYLTSIGLTEEDAKNIRYTIDNPQVASLSVHADFLGVDITALKTGTAQITATVLNNPQIKPVKCTITVYPKGTDPSQIIDEAYITTQQNVIVIPELNQTKNISVNLISIPASRQHLTQWNIENTSIASITASGNSAVVTSKAIGETAIIVTHPDAENTLKIMCRVGSDFVYDNPNLVYIQTSKDVVSLVKNSPQFQLNAMLVNSSISTGFNFTVSNPAIADITPYSNGICFIKPNEAGQAIITVTHPDSELSKQVIVLVGNTQEELDGLKYLSTSQNVVTISEGSTANISVQVKNSATTVFDGYVWETQDPSVVTIFSSGATAVFTGNKAGTTKITVKNPVCQYPLELIVIVVNPQLAAANPYIKPTQDIVNVFSGSSIWTTVETALIGGTDVDNSDFNWIVDDPAMAQLIGQGKTARVKSLSEGVTFITITHPKAQYSARIMLICDKSNESNCYISVPESIINVKPTDGSKTITASLINGLAEDKYNFSWFCDTYDVVELNYSANVASIRPIGQGQTTIHIKHPKAAYEQQIIVKVSEYTTFAFSGTNRTITQGTVSFITMQVPTTSVQTHIEYESANVRVATISGTKAVAQLTGVGEGSTIVKAKLVSSSTNIVQASAEMLVYVEKSNASQTYITTPVTTYTIERNQTKRLSADLYGANVEPTDKYNLKWISSDPSVVKLSGTSASGYVVGQEVIAQALKGGECTITISHDKCNTDLILYVIVPGQNEMDIALNKTYIRLETGTSTEMKATLTNATTADYKNIQWDLAKVDGLSLGTLLGTGQTVAIYAQKPGTTKLRATLPNGKYAECEVLFEASRSLTFDIQTMRVQPGQTKTFKYTISPADASIDWLITEDTYFSYSVDTNTKTVSITGIKEMSGSTTTKLTGVTQYGSKASISVAVAWDYNFSLQKSIIKSEPRHDSSIPDKFIIPYTVNPGNARIEVDITNDIASYIVDTQKKQIIVTPLKEGSASLRVRAYNNATNQPFPNMERTCNLEFSYSNLTIVPSIISKNGSFSRYDTNSGILVMGDGEEILLGLNVLEPNVDWVITSLEIVKNVSDSKNIKLTGGVSNSITIKHTVDFIQNHYYIKEWWSPYKIDQVWNNNNEKFDDVYTNIELDPKKDFRWDTDWYEFDAKFNYYLNGQRHYRRRTPAKDNTYLSISEYQTTAWWWRPYHDSVRSWNDYTYGPWAAEQSGNLSAELVPVTDRTIVSSVFTDKLVVIINHNNKTQRIEVPVYTETRACTLN